MSRVLEDTRWHGVVAQRVAKKLRTDIQSGLSIKEVLLRHKQYGKNIFAKPHTDSVLGVLLRQLKSPLVIILLSAGVVTLVLGHYVDATVIFIALSINVVIGIFQEERAGKAFARLSASQRQYATVVREGKKMRIDAEELVPGDIVILEAGSKVPADVRIVEVNELTANESALTGEWVHVDKSIEPVEEHTPLSERSSMVWMGTLIAGGTGTGIVIATGASTQMGQIATALGEGTKVQTPIQRNVKKLSFFLSLFVAGIAVLIFTLGILRGETLGDMLLLAVAVAVSVVPEGLPAAVTIVLALGMEKLLSRGGLVRNLLAAETLGSTTVILTDKTGTLTEAKMTVDDIIPLISLYKDSTAREKLRDDEREVLTMAVLSSDAFVERGVVKPVQEVSTDKMIVRGRPVERAIVSAALEMGLSQRMLQADNKQVDFLPFESANRFAASLNTRSDAKLKRFYVSGAPEVLLDHATHILISGKRAKLTEDMVVLLNKKRRAVSERGMRLIGIGYKDVSWDMIPNLSSETDRGKYLKNFTFAGLIVLNDPVRGDVKVSMKEAKGAGTRVIMLTGDNPQTARSVAISTGIASKGAKVYLGSELEALTDKELVQALMHTSVFARVLPQQKLRIVRVLKEHDEVVAMTGDGINDAPALRRADIGIALGSGTEVAKEASDLVLVEDSFSIIVSAIEEGRRIIDNLKKIVSHLLSTSFGEVFVIAGAILFGFPLPILPVQILWLNIVEEGFLSFAFAFEPAEDGVMRRNPRSERVKNILTPAIQKIIIIAGTASGLFTFGIYLLLLQFDLPIEEIRTIVFVALSLDAMLFALSLKDLHKPLWKMNFSSNPYLIFSLVVSAGVLSLAFLVPGIRTLLSLTTITALEVLLLVGVGLFNLFTIEIVKRFVFKRNKQ